MIIHDSCLTKFFAPPLSTLFYFFGVYDGGTVCVAVPWPPESGTVASYRYRERDNIITRQRQCWGAALANKKADCFVVGTARRNHKWGLVSIFRGRRFFSSAAHWFSMRAIGIFFFWKHKHLCVQYSASSCELPPPPPCSDLTKFRDEYEKVKPAGCVFPQGLREHLMVTLTVVTYRVK